MLYNYDILDSTADELTRRLDRADTHVPLAVLAKQQTAGRGRRGKIWASPVGNLYLSMGLPAPVGELLLVPLKAAVLIAEWLREFGGITPTIKWPNDILLGGSKVAGVLCEIHHSGAVAIGVGINLIPSEEIYVHPTTSLAEWGIPTEEAATVGEALFEYFAKHWATFRDADLQVRWMEFQASAFAFWTQEHNQDLLWSPGLSPAGHLVLAPLARSNERFSVVSVQHPYRCLYQVRAQIPVVIAVRMNKEFQIRVFFVNGTPQSELWIVKDARDQVVFSDWWRGAFPEQASGLWPLFSVGACELPGFFVLPIHPRPVRSRNVADVLEMARIEEAPNLFLGLLSIVMGGLAISPGL